MSRERLDPWSGRGVETGDERVSPDDLVISEIARATTTFAGAIELCESGFGKQAAMLNRSLFEGMAVAHWIHAKGEQACETFERAHRFERHLTAGVVDAIGWKEEVPAEALEQARLPDEDLADLQREFGRFGARLWTGHSLHTLVNEIEDQWTNEESRKQLWDFFRVVHRDNNQMLHSSIPALVGTVTGEDERGRTHRIGASDDHVDKALWAAHWCYANTFTLAIDRFELSDKSAYSEEIVRQTADFLLDNPELWIGTGRNDPCLCGSGAKYKRCHEAAFQERQRVLKQFRR